MRIQINDVALNCELAGKGRTLTLIHGLGGDLSRWAAFVPVLAEGYRVLTWDVRGFGQSDKPDEGYTPGQWAHDLSLLLGKLGIEKSYVLGISMGGVIAQRFALDYPQVVEALILVSTSSEVGERAAQAWEAQAAVLEQEGWDALAARRELAYAPAFAQAHPEILAEDAERIARNDPKAYVRATRGIGCYNFTPELHRISCPTLILQGEADVLTPPGGSVIMHRNIPGSELVLLKDCGHSIPIEQPQEFLRLLLGFLERVESRRVKAG